MFVDKNRRSIFVAGCKVHPKVARTVCGTGPLYKPQR